MVEFLLAHKGPKQNRLIFVPRPVWGKIIPFLEKIFLMDTWPVFSVKNFYTPNSLGGGPKMSDRNKFPITVHKFETKKECIHSYRKGF